jgi:hypothetical protein
MHFTNKILLCAALTISPAISQTPGLGSNPPNIHGETLNGEPIELPEAAAGKIAVLILGFSKQGARRHASGRSICPKTSRAIRISRATRLQC